MASTVIGISLATIEVCVFVRRLRSSHFLFSGRKVMKEKLVYEKKYPPSDRISRSCHVEEKASEHPSGDLYFGIRANTQYTIIPERDARSEEFIREAIRISELYRMDLRIVRHYEKISVRLALDFGNEMWHTNRLFAMADKISFFNDEGKRDLAADIEFYTHVVVKKGISVAP